MKLWGITSELMSLQEETWDIPSPPPATHTHRLHRGGVLGLFWFKPHSWLTRIIRLFESQIWPTLKAENFKRLDISSWIKCGIWALSWVFAAVHLWPLSAIEPPANGSCGCFLPRRRAARARRAPPKARAQRSSSPARDAASGRRTRSSRRQWSGCRPRWNSTSRRRCSSATSAGRSEAPSFPPSLSPNSCPLVSLWGLRLGYTFGIFPKKRLPSSQDFTGVTPLTHGRYQWSRNSRSQNCRE